MGIGRFLTLTLAVLLVAHQLVYLATYGPAGFQSALNMTGHDAYWLGTAVVVGLSLAASGAFCIRRWRRLRIESDRLSGKRRHRVLIDWGQFRGVVLQLVPRLALAAVLVFFVQENLEHYEHSGRLLGAGVIIGGDNVGVLPIFVLVATACAAITSFLRLGLATLARRLERVKVRRPEPTTSLPVDQNAPAYRWSHFAPDLGRAPPTLA